MTDEENQRQRHLAEMMIAECDGSVLQIKMYNEPWVALSSLLLLIHNNGLHVLNGLINGDVQIRIKPEPREWWVCEQCNGRMQVGSRCHGKNSKDGFLKCDGQLIHVREVLND